MGEWDSHIGGKVGTEYYRYIPRSPLPGVPRYAEGIQLLIPENMHGGIQGLRPGSKTRETNNTVLGITGGGNEGGEVLWPDFQAGESIEPGGTSINYSI